MQQYVRQGGVLSTSHYKRYNNLLLLSLEERYASAKIGSIRIPIIIVADDAAPLAQQEICKRWPGMQTIMQDLRDITFTQL